MVCWCRAYVNLALSFATRRRPAKGRWGRGLLRCGTIRSPLLVELYAWYSPEEGFEGKACLLFGQEGAASTNPFIRSALSSLGHVLVPVERFLRAFVTLPDTVFCTRLALREVGFGKENDSTKCPSTSRARCPGSCYEGIVERYQWQARERRGIEWPSLSSFSFSAS
jgi:hypothetical protein